jgi:hypothetical protein
MKARHDILSRAEASANRWVPVRPTDDQLQAAKPAAGHHAGQRVKGPHLRAVRKSSRSNIKVPGICKGVMRRYGREEVVFYVQLGDHSRRVYSGRIGVPEAFRRALELRSRWEERVEAANRAILAAREKNSTP